MNAVIKRKATPWLAVAEPPRSAIVVIDGTEWWSPIPENSGEAQSFNEDAERICERVKDK